MEVQRTTSTFSGRSCSESFCRSRKAKRTKVRQLILIIEEILYRRDFECVCEIQTWTQRFALKNFPTWVFWSLPLWVKTDFPKLCASARFTLRRKDLAKRLRGFPEKSERYLMMEFEDNSHLYFQGKNDFPIAYIEAAIFGNEMHYG